MKKYYCYLDVALLLPSMPMVFLSKTPVEKFIFIQNTIYEKGYLHTLLYCYCFILYITEFLVIQPKFTPS